MSIEYYECLGSDPQLGTLPPTIETSFNNTSIISFDMEYADPAVPRHAISLLALKLHHWRSQHVRMIRHAANKFARLAGSGNARYLDIPIWIHHPSTYLWVLGGDESSCSHCGARQSSCRTRSYISCERGWLGFWLGLWPRELNLGKVMDKFRAEDGEEVLRSPRLFQEGLLDRPRKPAYFH